MTDTELLRGFYAFYAEDPRAQAKDGESFQNGEGGSDKPEASFTTSLKKLLRSQRPQALERAECRNLNPA